MKVYFSNRDDGNIHYYDGCDYWEVERNRENIFSKLWISQMRHIFMTQTHSDHIWIVDDQSVSLMKDCDAFITKQKDIALVVKVADCVPILLADRHEWIIAAIHSGRIGTQKRILWKVLDTMIHTFWSHPWNIQVWIWPHIHSCCYQVGVSERQSFLDIFWEKAIQWEYIDLTIAHECVLDEFKIPKENRTISTICTRCSWWYFSYRNWDTYSRFCGIIAQ